MKKIKRGTERGGEEEKQRGGLEKRGLEVHHKKLEQVLVALFGGNIPGGHQNGFTQGVQACTARPPGHLQKV
jgi:hypothetical protein